MTSLKRRSERDRTSLARSSITFAKLSIDMPIVLKISLSLAVADVASVVPIDSCSRSIAMASDDLSNGDEDVDSLAP